MHWTKVYAFYIVMVYRPVVISKSVLNCLRHLFHQRREAVHFEPCLSLPTHRTVPQSRLGLQGLYRLVHSVHFYLALCMECGLSTYSHVHAPGPRDLLCYCGPVRAARTRARCMLGFALFCLSVWDSHQCTGSDLPLHLDRAISIAIVIYFGLGANLFHMQPPPPPPSYLSS